MPDSTASARPLSAPAWLDSFKTLLVRYETNVENWLAFHFLAFTVLLLRKIPPNEEL